ncbi:homeobox protein SMOX-1-like [Odontomachus brunneus]|uniref:homeobox protein SMOX-1-like n=1 Tax=Odontomachus brunneus TaxID=486640 RepID=UPI0013F1C1C0|nr:homeobox protein SMOX-1-like [Odontomachus brunneus]
MLDMTCNSANICSYGIKQLKPKQGKQHTSLPHFDEVWQQQNQQLQQDLPCYEQSFLNQSQSTSSPTLQYLLEQGKKKAENRSVVNVSQASLYNSTYNNQYNSQYNNLIAPYMSNQNASSVTIQPHYQPIPMTLPSTEQHLRYQQQNVYYENGQSYLPNNTYSSNYNSLLMTSTTVTQNLRSSVVRPLQKMPQENNLYAGQQYIAQQSYAGNSSEQNQIVANNQESSVVRSPQEVLQKNNLYATQQYVARRSYAANNSEQQNQTVPSNQQSSVTSPLQEVPQEDNLYTTQQYVTQQIYAGNNSEQQNQTVPNSQQSSVTSPLQEVPQEDNLYTTQQYITQQSYASNNNAQRSHIATNDSKSKQQPYAWLNFKHGPGNENKRARKRQTYTQQQTFKLEEVFYGSRYLSKAERVKLSKELNLSEQQIKIWFQNRRMKAKKEQQSQLPVNQQHLRFNETPVQEQLVSQQESIMHQQQSTAQTQPSMQQQWPATQQPQLHQRHQTHQNSAQQQTIEPRGD